MELELNANTLRDNEKKFFEYNNLRLKVSNQLLTEKQKHILQFIPFLLHTNIKGMPGYIETKNPVCGIVNYEISESIVKLTANKFGVSSPKITENKIRAVESLSLMGSIGSIAQNEKSDFDFWLCFFGNNLMPDDMELLLNKIRLIELWSAENKVETHFFPMDIHKIYNNDFGSAGGESCGSAQAALLKDEYFRSSIMIAGKTPLWWVFPEQQNEKLNMAIWEKLKTEDKTLIDSFINIGNINKIEQQEFFGAALWQLVKSLDSPYKSFIKMSLLEKYINSGSELMLLSEKLKKIIWSGKIDFKKVDQYILMFNSISEYFETQNENDVLDILRECFYLKVQPELTLKSNRTEEDVKVEIMSEYCRNWNWKKTKIEFLDSFQKWTMNELIKFDSQIKKYMINNYVKISNVLKTKNVSAIISDYDMTIIGRKLVSYYSKKQNKVEYFYFSLQDNFFEENINIIDTGDSWMVTRAKISGRFNNQQNEGLIYQSKYLSDICVWLAYNHIYNEWCTQLKLFTNKPVEFNNIREFLRDLETLLKKKEDICKNSKFYINDSFIIKCAITVNFDNFAGDEKKMDIMFMYLTSWGELFVEHYSSYKEIYVKLNEVMASYKKIAHLFDFDDFLSFYAPKGVMNICLPIKRLIDQLYHFFFKLKWFGSEQKIFITFCDGEYGAYSNTGYDFKIVNTTSMANLFESFFIFKNKQLFYEYDKNILNTVIYSTIFSKLATEKNQLFFFDSGKYYLWIFFDNFNLPSVGAVAYSKLDEALEAINDFIKINCGKTPVVYELKKNLDNNYSITEYRIKKKNDLSGYFNFDVEFRYFNDNDINDSSKFSVITKDDKFDFSDKQAFVKFIQLYFLDLKEKYFNIQKLTIIPASVETKTFIQPSVYLRIKHKFERFIFSNIQLLSQIKKD